MSWQTVNAGELMVKRGGSVDPSKYPDEIFDLLSIPAFDKGQIEILSGSEIGSSKINVEPNDVLLAKIIPHIRRCWVVPEKGNRRQIGSGEWIVFRDKRFYPDFLKHFLTSDIFHKQFMGTVAGVGGSLVRARPAAVEKIEIPLPPLEEQKRIAAILDKADAIRRKRQQAIKLADDFLRSVFLEMFGDPVTNPKGWDKCCIGDVCEVQGGLQVSTKREGLPLLKPYLRVANVLRNKLDLSEIKFMNVTEAEASRIALKQNDILVVEGHGNKDEIGRCAIWNGDIEDVIHQNHLIRVRVKAHLVTAQLVNDYINSSGGRSQMLRSSNTTSGLNTISTGIVKSTEMYLPPIDMQISYERICKKVSFLLSKVLSSKDASNENFLSLSKKAFSGVL